MTADDPRQGGGEVILGVPRYREAMIMIAEWEQEEDEFANLIPRLYRLWVNDDQPAYESLARKS